ncbi:hypothetical protein BDP27DRAFT_1332259, partial [Rhodocollybia butyracea]
LQCFYAVSMFKGVVLRPVNSADLVLASILTVNICSTALIGIKVWIYRRATKAMNPKHNRLTKSQQVLLFWIESGVVFCAVQVLYLVTTIPGSNLGSLGHISATLGSVQTWLIFLIPLIVGLCFTIMLLMVKLKLSVVEQTVPLQTVARNQSTQPADNSTS